MLYRKATINDANYLDNLLTRLIEDETKYDPNCELVKVKDFYINYINDNKKYFEVCEDNNKIVGYIYSIFNDNNAKIDALFVDEEYRNNGLATNLLEHFIKYCRNNNIKYITINVLENNVNAKKLYSKYFKLNKKDNLKEELIMEVSD